MIYGILIGLIVIGVVFIAISKNRLDFALKGIIIFLSVYTLLLSLLFKLTQSVLLINILKSIKELIPALFILIVFLASKITMKLKLVKLDLYILLFGLLCVVYLSLPGSGSVKFFGFKSLTFFLLPYVLGRIINLKINQKLSILKLFVSIGLLASLLGLIEFIFYSSIHELTGYSAYNQFFFNQNPSGHYGLTWTFETGSGHRRFSSFFANPLEYASSILLIFPIAFGIFNYNKENNINSKIGRFAFLIIAVSIIFPFSRASSIALMLEFFVIAIVFNKTRMLLNVVVISFTVFALLFISGKGVRSFVINTITFENASSKGHLEEWGNGFSAILDTPLGHGLGTSGTIGARFDNKTGGENQFVINGVQLGILGLLLYLLIIWESIRKNLQLFRYGTGIDKWIGFVVVVTRIGIIIPTFTSAIETYLFLSFSLWLLTGISVKASINNKKIANIS